MNLRRLQINRLPGINVPFAIEPDGAKFHVVFGPNGIGKSSLCRAVEGLYWNDGSAKYSTSVNGEFDLDGETWWAEREGSRVRWQHDGADSAPPNLPASYTRNCFFLRLRDLIDPAPEGTQDVASEIRRQMSGGFDLQKIVSEEFKALGSRLGRNEFRNFNRAVQAVQQAEGEHTRLQRRADELNALQEQLVKAEANRQRLEFVDRASGLVERQGKLTGLLAELEALPNSLADLNGKETDQIETDQEKLETLNGRITAYEAELAEADQSKLDAELDAPLDAAELAAWREYADELGRVEIALQTARTEYNGVRAELASALAAVGGSNVDEIDLDLEDHSNLFEFLRDAEDHKAKVQAIEERLRLLSGVDQPEESESDIENIRSAVSALRSWLRAPDPEIASKEGRVRRTWMIVAAALIAIGLALAIFIDPTFALLAAIGAGIGLPLFLRRQLQVGSNERQVAQDSFQKFGIEQPQTWEPDSVDALLRDLDNRIAVLDAQHKRARDRDVERQSFKTQLEGFTEAQPKLDEQRQQLQESLKFDTIRPDADLVDFARSLDQVRLARNKEQNTAGEVESLENRHSDLLSDLSVALKEHGETRPTDAATVKASLNQLANRDAQLRSAISDHQVNSRQLEQAKEDRDAAENAIAQVYATAGLNAGDLHGLTIQLGLLPRYMELKTETARLESQNDLDLSELTKADEAALAELDELDLERLRDDLSRSAEDADDLRDEIADIKAAVNTAQSGHDIQDLIAARDAALTKLNESRSGVLYAQAGRFLMDGVEQEYEQTQMPRVFERARDLFSEFTHHHYELRLGSAAEVAQLIATDLQSGESLELEQLSDGTRAQLLLAARIAFAEEVEQGRALPLFLDEALDQSDPARYEAIVRSLGRVAADQGRQIFYLTSDPADVNRIQHALAEENCEAPALIDLGLIRRSAASVSGSSELHVDPRPPVLAPDGLSADEYGAAIGVPPLDPSRGYVDQHFFHVLWDDLDLLHEFLTYGIERVGQWRTVVGTPLAEKLGSHSKAPEEISHRSALLENFCEFWNQGRGRPVDRDVLEDSDALSDRWLDTVVEIAGELFGDPERLLETLRSREDERLKGFRSNALEKLEGYMRENGYVDEHPVLDEEEIRLRALASPAATHLPEGIADECLNRWWTLAARSVEPETNGLVA